MLDVVDNPFGDPLNKVISDLKETKWKIPFILPLVHGIISIFLIILLVIMYATLGFVSQVSNSFWKVVIGQGQKMSFSMPLSSFYYAISASVFFVIFLPFFALQSPFWISGWIASRIGFNFFITLLLLVLAIYGLLYFQPQMADIALEEISGVTNSLMSTIFPPDTLNIQIDQSILNTLEEQQ